MYPDKTWTGASRLHFISVLVVISQEDSLKTGFMLSRLGSVEEGIARK